ncbi:MAG: carbohydrate kinase [Clostridia bacterium]|nr:carbohydrate kinase [Clostridia bacterium]
MKLGGIDVGTTGCKLTVYNEKGEFLHNSYVTYEISRNTGEHEIDGAVIFNGVKDVIKDTAAKVGKLDAIGVTTFGETFVLLDKEDNILFPSMLYTDPRGTEEAEAFDPSEVTQIAGVKPHAMFSLPKLMWVKNHRPDVYQKTERVLLFQDYIVYMLTGVAQIDQSLAARTMGLDIRNGCWSEKIFQVVGIAPEKMSRVVPSGTVAGCIKPELGAELGMEGTMIVSGCHDQVASATGAGVFDAGLAVDGTGTVECITPVFDRIPEQEELYQGSYAVVPYIEKGKYVCYAFSFTGGAAIKWYRDTFAPELSYKELDAQIKNTPGQILLLPHFAGAATPYMDSFSKAAMVGVTLETTKSDLYQAIMEGVTYEMLLNVNRLRKADIVPKQLYATGGGASSPVWLQMKADILGVPMTSLNAPEVGALGTIMLTGVAIGAFASVRDAAKIFVKEGATYYPDMARHQAYMVMYEKYEKLYDAVRPLV